MNSVRSRASFNQMSEGLTERDRVRDLLGKVVSPEVATELLRKDVVLGGEEREVAVLFSDLRNFTSMSELLSPHEMVGDFESLFQPDERDCRKVTAESWINIWATLSWRCLARPSAIPTMPIARCTRPSK